MRAVLIVNPNATSTTAAGLDLLAHALESRAVATATVFSLLSRVPSDTV